MVFDTLRRQQFRRYFQPSRIVIALLPAPVASGVNPITICFCTYCAYKPVMLAVAIHKINASFALVNDASDYVLAVPGAGLANEAMHCGTVSMAEQDKVKELGLELLPSQEVETPGIAKAIANVELVKTDTLITGDHVLLIGRVRGFRVNQERDEPPLLSVGPDTRGYTVLSRKGVHRIGVVAARRSDNTEP